MTLTHSAPPRRHPSGAPARRSGRPSPALFSRRLSPRGLLWLAPAVLILLSFVYWPLMQNFAFSMTEWDVYTGTREFVGLENFSRLAADPVFHRSLLNNLLYAGLSLIFQVAGALLLAVVIESRRSERLRRALRAIYFVPSAISLTVAGLLFYFIYEPKLGMLNHLLEAVNLGALAQPWLGQESTAMLGIIMMSQWQGFGYSTLLFAVAIQRIPRELYEAAEIDGIGPVRQFFTITVPLVREMSGLMVIVTISGAFQVFNEVMVMTSGGPNNSTQVLGTWLYHNGFSRNDFGYAAAIATVIFVVTISIGLVQMWYTKRRRVQW